MDEAINKADGYCLWESRGNEFVVGIVGTGPGFYSILEIIHDESCEEFIPPLRLESIASPELGGRGRPSRLPGVDICPDYEVMMERHPDINLVVELTGSVPLSRKIRRTLPNGTSFLDHNMAVFLCGLKDMAKAKSFCLMDLDRHQALLRAIIDEVREDILLLNANRTVVDLNRNVMQRAGMAKEKLIGLNCWDVQALGNGPPICPSGPDPDCPFEKTLKEGVNGETMITRVDNEGRLKYYRVYSYPIHSSRGSLTNVLIMRRDITERTLRERHIQQVDKMAAIGEMSTYLAHEIRNPLLAIGGFTNSLKASPNLTDREREKLDIVALEAKRLENLLSCVLNFARPNERNEGETDLARAVRDTVDLMTIGYADKGVRFSVASTPTVPIVSGNPEQVKQCLINILKNSVEAMPEGGEISINIGKEHRGGFVTISDSGVGMSEKEIENAFSPFYSTKGGGCGPGDWP